MNINYVTADEARNMILSKYTSPYGYALPTNFINPERNVMPVVLSAPHALSVNRRNLWGAYNPSYTDGEQQWPLDAVQCGLTLRKMLEESTISADGIVSGPVANGFLIPYLNRYDHVVDGRAVVTDVTFECDHVLLPVGAPINVVGRDPGSNYGYTQADNVTYQSERYTRYQGFSTHYGGVAAKSIGAILRQLGSVSQYYELELMIDSNLSKDMPLCGDSYSRGGSGARPVSKVSSNGSGYLYQSIEYTGTMRVRITWNQLHYNTYGTATTTTENMGLISRNGVALVVDPESRVLMSHVNYCKWESNAYTWKDAIVPIARGSVTTNLYWLVSIEEKQSEGALAPFFPRYFEPVNRITADQQAYFLVQWTNVPTSLPVKFRNSEVIYAPPSNLEIAGLMKNASKEGLVCPYCYPLSLDGWPALSYARGSNDEMSARGLGTRYSAQDVPSDFASFPIASSNLSKWLRIPEAKNNAAAAEAAQGDVSDAATLSISAENLIVDDCGIMRMYPIFGIGEDDDLANFTYNYFIS